MISGMFKLLTSAINFICSLFNIMPPMRFAIQSVGTVLDYFFKDRGNRSVFDIFAGILLLCQVNRQVPKVSDGPSEPAIEANVQPWQRDYFDRKLEAVRDVNRFVDYAMAIYNCTFLYMVYACFFRPMTSLYAFFYFFTFGPSSIFPFLFERREIIGDSIFFHKTASFMASAPLGTKLNDLKFANFTNGVFQTPYCIVVDKVAKAIVVTIKGSLLLEDWLTDFNFMAKGCPNVLKGKQFDEYPPLEKNGMAIVPGPEGRQRGHATASYPFIQLNGKKIHVHHGMYLCARSMFGEVESQLISIIQSETEVKDYDIVLTGHSEGAGVASLLTLMFQDQWGDKVRGYCFSTPGCIISVDGLKESHKCILSINLGDDLITRASYHSTKDLREDCHQIMQVQHNGLNLFDSLKYPLCIKFICELLSWPLTIFVNIPHYVFVKYCRWSYGIDLEDKFAIRGPSRVLSTELEDTDDRALRLYPSGQLLQLTVDKHTHQVHQNWISHDDLQEFIISLNMITDHIPKRVHRCVKRESSRIFFIPIDSLPTPIRFVLQLLY